MTKASNNNYETGHWNEKKTFKEIPEKNRQKNSEENLSDSEDIMDDMNENRSDSDSNEIITIRDKLAYNDNPFLGVSAKSNLINSANHLRCNATPFANQNKKSDE